MSKLKSLPSVSLIIEKAKGRLNIHENYLKLLINKEQVNPDGIQIMSGMITIPHTSGMVLQKIN